jgi:glutamate synthase (NADPH/NADH) small chain
MANMQALKTKMPEQLPKIRRENFTEVALGYSAEDAVQEANRCLGCKNRPCVAKCPVNVAIPEFIAELKKGDFAAAASIVKRDNSLAAVCGRVCPQEVQCESACVRGIKGESVAIGRLERFAADFESEAAIDNEEKPQNNGKKVAVVGGGPAGLTCAGELAKMGYSVTVFEALHTAGGVLMYGIPEFRLPKRIVEKEIECLKLLGVEIITNVIVGKSLKLQDLWDDGFNAVFLGTGAGLPNFMKIPGENLIGVYSANEFLTRVNLLKAYNAGYDTPLTQPENVSVIGGGNVAMDAARCALRLGAKTVSIIYRRSEDEMPARNEEIHHAKEEGIEFLLLTNPVQILGDADSKAVELECVKMELGEPDSSGRRRPVEVEGSNFKIAADTIIMAIGNAPNPTLTSAEKELETNRWNCLVVDEDTLQTSIKGVYAGGDAVTGAATVILAMGAGKKAAAAIDDYLKNA